jgi:hypothetical protein
MPRGRFSPLPSITSMIDHPLVAPEPTSGCWLWFGHCTSGGYGHVRRPGGKHILTHRLSWELEGRTLPAGMILCHKCNNRACCNPDHLYAGTHKDNMADAVRAGTLQRRFKGMKHPMRKLTELDVLTLRALPSRSASVLRGYARAYGVSLDCVKDAVRGRTWGHI